MRIVALTAEPTTMLTWQEDFLSDDSVLFDGERYVGRVVEVKGAFHARLQTRSDAGPGDHDERIVGIRPKKSEAQALLTKHWQEHQQ